MFKLYVMFYFFTSTTTTWNLTCRVSATSDETLFLVVSTSAINRLERGVSKMTNYMSSGTWNPTHSLSHSWTDTCMRVQPKSSVMKSWKLW